MRLWLSILLVLVGTTLASADILSVKKHTVEILDSTTPYATQVVLVVPRYYPLNIVEEKDGHYKVSDCWGREGWVEKDAIEAVRTVVVTATGAANIRNGPGTEHEVLFRANQGVAFRVLEEKPSWLKVVHESGQRGWIYKSIVWGLESKG